MSSQWRLQYHQHVLATDPIAYWLLDEKSGNVAYDRVDENGAQNGTHVGVTLGQPGIGDGRTSPLYDGANDYTNVYSVPFNAAFDGSECSVMIWARVAGAGVWTDGVDRHLFRLLVNGANHLFLRKQVGNNQAYVQRQGSGVTDGVTVFALTTTDWMAWTVTVSESADEMRLFLNGVQQGLTQVGLGAWVGNLNNTQTVVGASWTGGPNNVWSGTLAHCSVWDYALAPTTVADLYGLGISH